MGQAPSIWHAEMLEHQWHVAPQLSDFGKIGRIVEIAFARRHFVKVKRDLRRRWENWRDLQTGEYVSGR